MGIALVRIDDRMIHGQIVMSWIRYTDAKQILLIDDAVSSDETMKKVLLSIAPKNLVTKIISVQEALAEYPKAQQSTTNTLVIVRNPSSLVRMADAGLEISAVNLGGLGIGPNKTKLYKNIAINAEEREDLRNLLYRGIPIYIQMVSSDKKKPLSLNDL